jgi:hypothetical protein
MTGFIKPMRRINVAIEHPTIHERIFPSADGSHHRRIALNTLHLGDDRVTGLGVRRPESGKLQKSRYVEIYGF